MYTCMLCNLRIIHVSPEPIGYSTKIGTDGVERGNANHWIVLPMNFEEV